MRVTLLTNGPGELWGWVRPLAWELRKRGHSVSLWLLPCQFASGYEREAASLLAVDKLEGPNDPAGLWQAMAQERTDCVVQLGGDLIFGRRIANSKVNNKNTPLLCYTYGAKSGLNDATQIFTAYPVQALKIKNKSGVRARTVCPIGDLVKDSLAMDVQEFHAHVGIAGANNITWQDWEYDESSPRILFLPGSRAPIRKAALPWLAALESELRYKIPNVRVRTLLPMFMPDSEITMWRDAGLSPVRVGAGVAMSNADFAVTQPGTNNFELMHCGLPALVIAPSDFFNLIPLSGVRGVVANLPLIGPALRKSALRHVLNRWNGVIALPNRLTREPVMDELYGDITPSDVAARVASSLRDAEQLARTREALLALSNCNANASATRDKSQRTAAAKLCDAIPTAGRLENL